MTAEESAIFLSTKNHSGCCRGHKAHLHHDRTDINPLTQESQSHLDTGKKFVNTGTLLTLTLFIQSMFLQDKL